MKNTRLSHAEYYGMTEKLDKLFAESKENNIFTNLMSIITSNDNILLAYRNIKRNNGSATAGEDKVTIRQHAPTPIKFSWLAECGWKNG